MFRDCQGWWQQAQYLTLFPWEHQQFRRLVFATLQSLTDANDSSGTLFSLSPPCGTTVMKEYVTLAGFHFLSSFSLTVSPSFSGGNSLAVRSWCTFCFLYLSFSLGRTSLGSYSWGLSISVTGIKVLRRLPMSIWASDQLTPSNGVFQYERRALYGSSA